MINSLSCKVNTFSNSCFVLDVFKINIPFCLKKEAEEYTMNVSSVALGMEAAKETVENNGAEILWDDVTMQDYATWTAGDVTYKIWLENEKSLEPKLALMKEKNLAVEMLKKLIAEQVKVLVEEKIDVCIVIGGGNIFRGKYNEEDSYIYNCICISLSHGFVSEVSGAEY